MNRFFKFAVLPLIIYCLSGVCLLFAQSGPQPGDIYKEFSLNLKTGRNWRVTDPTVTREDALPFLPNPVLSININDLQGAIKAEVLMDIWSGHVGTSNKRFRFNNNDWIRIPEVPTIAVQPECYFAQSNVIMELPLSYLVEGVNTFEGTSGGQICNNYNWGQWGWYVMMVRVYYGPEKAHTKGSIQYPVSGATILDNPEISVNVENAQDVAKVEILGKYYGYDQKGLGYYNDWHWAYHGVNIEGHIGTATTSPFKRTWNTTWVPDQQAGGVSFKARIQGKNGVWYVTDIVDNITLDRSEGGSVKMYTASEVPQNFVVRIMNNGNPRTRECKIIIADLDQAAEARFFHRTWNAADDDAGRGTIELPLGINGNGFKTLGVNHFFALSSLSIPTGILVEGKNNITYTSNTSHHGIEVMWPGPAIMVRYNKGQSSVPYEKMDLLGYWGFNENTGSKAADGSLYKNDLLLSTGTTFSDGKYGNALSMTKADKHHAYTSNSALSPFFLSSLSGTPAEAFTIAAWVRLTTIDDRSTVISKEEMNKRGFEFGLRNGYMSAQIYKDNTNFSRTEGQGTQLTAGEWYHIAMTYEFVEDGTSVIKHYLNGVEDYVFNTAVGPVAINDADLRIGAYYWSTTFFRYFNGLIDELYVFNKVLSQEDIAKIMNSESLTIHTTKNLAGNSHLNIYPNPARDQLNFKLALTAPSQVTLSVHSVQGLEVMNVMNLNIPAGYYQETLDISGLKPGVYFVSLRTSYSTDIRRLVVY
jgi:hypothetical protein